MTYIITIYQTSGDNVVIRDADQALLDEALEAMQAQKSVFKVTVGRTHHQLAGRHITRIEYVEQTPPVMP